MTPDDPKLTRWSRFLEALGGLLGKLIWLAIVLIVLATLGRYYIFRDASKSETSRERVATAAPAPDWAAVDASIAEALRRAHETARAYAAKELERYGDSLKQRIDTQFLEWYFGYWNQQLLGIEGLFHEGWHYFDASHPGAREAITEKVQEEFAKRVLRPAISQMELERIMRDTVSLYLQQVRRNLESVPKRFKIKPVDWERHLEGIAVTTVDVDGNRRVDLSLKALTVGGAAGSAYALKALAPFAKNLGSKVAAQLAGKTAAKMAAKTGGKVAAKAGGKFLGPIIGIGIIIWDAWDHHHTREINEPILRRNLHDYVDLMVRQLLEDPESGVMAPVDRIQSRIVASL